MCGLSDAHFWALVGLALVVALTLDNMCANYCNARRYEADQRRKAAEAGRAAP